VAYIFHQDQLPRLEGATGGRVRTFFVNRELTKIDDMLAGVMTYTKGTASPLHYHEVCEHFYFIMEGNAQVETPEGIQPVGPGMMIFIPAEQKHRLRALTPLFYFEFQALQDAHPRGHRRRPALDSERGRRGLVADVVQAFGPA
jgi:mannose-6-phosphate isomerase-like protein (cupin superfamily)